MDITTSTTEPIAWCGDGLALGVTSLEITPEGFKSPWLQALNDQLQGFLGEWITEVEFQGKPGTIAFTRIQGAPYRKLILVGLGVAPSLTLESLRRGAAAAVKMAAQEQCQHLGLYMASPDVMAALEPETPNPDGAALMAQALAEGSQLALYRDDRFRSDPKPLPPLAHITLLGVGEDPALATALERAQHICQGVALARQLVAAPANSLTPVTFADIVTQLAQDHGLELTILEREQCQERGMGAFLGVAQASDLPPKFVHLVYRPEGTPRRKLAIVGKGLTFDSGGLNLKVGASSIEIMKTDMGGAGAMFGAAQAISLIKPDVEVHFISAITENMVSGRALRPGDVLTASNGKTIEVNNTDAEGRLTLADALVYADALEADALVDLATLTGACVVALGESIAGLWSADDDLAADLLQAATTAGEKLWRMPLETPYFESMKSVVADMKNTGGRAGGSISAALFLQQFVQNTPWAHLDVAGPVWSDKADGYNPAGATGYGVRTLVQWILA